MQVVVAVVALVQAQEVLVGQAVVAPGAQRQEVLLLREPLIQVVEEGAVALIPAPRMLPQLAAVVVLA
jgi:hypothetical protein